MAFFSPVVIPVERLDRFVNESRPIVPDVRSNARPFEGRIYVLLLDNYHTAALRSALVKKAAHEFIDKYLGANDVAAVIHTSGGATDAAQEFTNDPRLLHASIDRFIGQKLRSRTLERLDEYNRNPMLQPQAQGDGQTGRDVKVLDPLDRERGFYASSDARHAAQPGRLHGVDPGPAQGDPDVQRGHRLSDPRRLRFARRLDDPERHA